MAKKESKARGPSGELRSATATDGVELQYEVLGEGPAIALLHGGLAGRAAFSRQREALTANRRIVLPSMRGHDGTDATLPADYGIAASEVRDLATVLDAEGTDRIDLLGHSSGGATAFAFARKFPERVGRLILIEPTLLALLSAPVRDPLTASLCEIIKISETEAGTTGLRAILDLLGGDGWKRMPEETKSTRLAAMANMAPFIAPHFRALLKLAVTAIDLKSLRPPTLLIYGRESFDFQTSLAECWRRTRPDLSLLTAEGAGHNVHRDRPDFVNSAVLRFLDGDTAGNET